MNKVRDRVLPMALTINHHGEREENCFEVKHPLGRDPRNNDTLHFQWMTKATYYSSKLSRIPHSFEAQEKKLIDRLLAAQHTGLECFTLDTTAAFFATFSSTGLKQRLQITPTLWGFFSKNTYIFSLAVLLISRLYKVVKSCHVLQR